MRAAPRLTADPGRPPRRKRFVRASTASLVALGLLLAGCGSGGGADGAESTASAKPSSSPSAAPGKKVDDPAVPADAPPTTAEPSAEPSSDAPSPSETTEAAAPAPSDLASVSGGSCSASATADVTTSTGANPVSAYSCRFDEVADGAAIVFVRWADSDSAAQFWRDAADAGPRIDNFDAWTLAGQRQGPLWTNETDGQVVCTGLYEGGVYTWQIRTRTADQGNEVFSKVTFKDLPDTGSDDSSESFG